MGQHDPLLVATLDGMRQSIDKIGDAVQEQGERLARIEERLTHGDARMQRMEESQQKALASVKRDARKWGAIAGASSGASVGLAGIFAALAKLAFFQKS